MALYTGKTVEEAIETGLKDLQIPRLKAHIRVISKEKKGFLGIGKKLAQVDVEGISDKTVYKADKKAVRGVPDEINRQNAPVVNPEQLTREGINSPTGDDKTDSLEASVTDRDLANQARSVKIDQQIDDSQNNSVATETSLVEENEDAVEINHNQADASFEAFVTSDFSENTTSKDIEKATEEVADYVTKIIYEMDIEATIEKSYTRRQINLKIDTQEAGRVIGYHGKVLKSLQLLAQNFLHDRYSRNFSVALNVHDYVEHRTETLIDFTQKVASRVLESRENYTMDPMSNSERKIVHKTIANIEGVESFSEGNDPNRYVVVSIES
ncbi:ssDNA-binding protein [Streptococcus porcinus]|uniref:RNA-binding cell elongation regulator Jag/EloR n=1 Tax=Streptococcus porcinus TaxID=1340 RepID=UPI0010CAC97B|nr:RNA-binding cell elongation regulator Jag/EloR [Streptococcus porcinus]VTS45453.1 ssDNA-binding protein [Streptococcus porcinus]